jgi:hypothetical protein
MMFACENYLDPDVAYLLGMLVARGTIIDREGNKKIEISFPARNLFAPGITKSFDQKKHIRQAAYGIKERLEELMEAKGRVSGLERETNISLTFIFGSRNMTWRNVRYLLSERTSQYDFQVPENIFRSPTDIKKEFVRGVADCAGFIRQSNNYMGGKRRVYLEINNRNWLVPVQICRLLQVDLSVPVQLIQWGHPNVRMPNDPDNPSTVWAKEHQVKIFAESYLSIGFHSQYKQAILEEFADDDKEIKGSIRPCNPNPKIRRIKPKETHIGELSEILPASLRGKHFDAYWQICTQLGCQQCVEVPREESFEDDLDVDRD